MFTYPRWLQVLALNLPRDVDRSTTAFVALADQLQRLSLGKPSLLLLKAVRDAGEASCIDVSKEAAGTEK